MVSRVNLSRSGPEAQRYAELMRWAITLGLLLTMVTTNAHSKAASDRDRLVGTWRLVSVEATANGSVSYPLGRAPSGLLVFTNSGHWAAELMGEAHAGNAGDPRVTYRAHFGTFTVDPGQRLLTLHRTGDLDRAGIDADTLRYYTFEGKRVVMRLPPERRQGVEVVTRVTWERLD